MPFPFLGRYLWGEGRGIAQRHFQTAKREHEDLSEIAQVMNNLEVRAVELGEDARIERNGVNWVICVPCLESCVPSRANILTQ